MVFPLAPLPLSLFVSSRFLLGVLFDSELRGEFTYLKLVFIMMLQPAPTWPWKGTGVMMEDTRRCPDVVQNFLPCGRFGQVLHAAIKTEYLNGQPPPPGELKLNLNGAFFESNKSGIRGFVTDCSALVGALTSRNFECAPGGVVFRQIRALLQMDFPNVKVSFAAGELGSHHRRPAPILVGRARESLLSSAVVAAVFDFLPSTPEALGATVVDATVFDLLPSTMGGLGSQHRRSSTSSHPRREGTRARCYCKS
uniref:RNase H type-1 domain-containing protein n=1 Tax=Oryza glumipatula TaxID=40148 RepID=A0A0E0ATN5_9ORYZ